MTTKDDIMSDDYIIPKNKAGILADYDHIRRLANDRMRSIENVKTKTGLENLTEYAYKRAVHDLQGATRFPTKKQIEKLNYNAIVKRMNDMRRFLRSESSTIRGTKGIYNRNAKLFNEKYSKYGANFTSAELAKFFDKDTGLYEKIKAKHPDWGSDTIMKAIATIARNRSEVIAEMKKENDKHNYI